MNLKKFWFDMFNDRKRITKLEISFFLVTADNEEIEHSSTSIKLENKKEYYYKNSDWGMDKYDLTIKILKDPGRRDALHKEMTRIWTDLPEEIHLNSKIILIKANLIGMRWKDTYTECTPLTYQDTI